MKKPITNRWKIVYGNIALAVAEASKDPSTKVGAVIFRPDKTIASVGFNGLPNHIPDDPDKLVDRDWKNANIIHAEKNAIDHCADSSLEGYGIVTTFHPCKDCAEIIVKSGIKQVYYLKAAPDAEKRWAESFAISRDFLESNHVQVFEIE